jgi:FKBP-type peptidyl-prolyl cis-trans isomerase FkpA
MLKKLFAFIAIAILFVSCKKATTNSCPYTASTAVAPASEITALQGYITANHPTAVQHSSGVFYEISAAGTGATPGVCSTITVKYTGTLTNGSKFDENLTGYTNTLGGLIQGWQRALPLIKAGGSITLYIPPSLGYGSQDIRNNSGAIIIPANSILIFTIQLVAVQ